MENTKTEENNSIDYSVVIFLASLIVPTIFFLISINSLSAPSLDIAKKSQAQSARKQILANVLTLSTVMATSISTPDNKFTGIVENVEYNEVVTDSELYHFVTIYFQDGRIIHFLLYDLTFIFERKCNTEITYHKESWQDDTQSYIIDNVKVYNSPIKSEKE